MTRNSSSGFTLVEVMLALAILLAGLTVLIRTTASNIYTSERAHLLGVATGLAQGKMYDLEAELLDQGFQEQNQELDGDFDDEGWEDIKWSAEIIKVELPELSTVKAMAEDGTDGSGEDTGTGVMGGLLGSADPSAATGDTEQGGGIAGALLSSQYELFRGILEQSIRKVTLTVSWEVMGEAQSMVVVCYFTEPAVVQRVVGAGPAPGAGQAPEDGKAPNAPGQGKPADHSPGGQRGGLHRLP
ncbi:MAG TPA: prepilin-type N-terminal cleavage/methylation domain-containing protein [Kofleriaceae bacterium]|nr:prepilin-type N-terminal cleavage/methylation domain-containing protein [Kofleriaceae bacterium]